MRRVIVLRAAAAALALAALALGGCAPTGSGAPAGPHEDSALETGDWTSATDPAMTDAVTDLPVEELSTTAAPHLAEGVVPPTSRWYSSLAFSADPLPVYPYPLAFLPGPGGFTVQRPAVTTTATTIAAPFTGGLALDLGAGDYRVARTDPVSVTLAYTGAGTADAIAEVTIAEGSPIVAVAAVADLTIVLPGGDGGARVVTDGVWAIDVDGVTYLLVARRASLDGSVLRVPGGSALQVAVLPADGDPAAWADAIGDAVTHVTVDHRLGDDMVATRLTYAGTDRTVVVPFAGREAAASCTLGTYETPYGRAPACAGPKLEWSVPRLAPAAAYDLSGLDDERRAELATQAGADLAATGDPGEDTYFGGKGLARLAALLSLARALGDDELADSVADRLMADLTPWLSTEGCLARASRCFVYDDRLHLVVGQAVGFGAEDGNDHHFHYGYFLAAAAALAQERPDTIESLTPVMNALAADIAGGSGGPDAGAAGDTLTALRVFDPYRGHSWAAGLAPFADGNNQESSSEAVAAWNALALWAEVTGDEALQARAVWLLAAEADTARSLWLEPTDLPDAYAHSIVSLTWSDKRDYATWFSAEPSAILGIQALPLGPVSLQYLAGDADRVAANVADAGEAAFDGPLGDYVLGYSALGGADALARATELVDTRNVFDDGWSKALAQAWIAAVAAGAQGVQ